MNFNFNLPVNLHFGRGIVSELGQQTALYGKKALLVTGTSSTKKSGLLDRALGLLEEAGVSVTVFDKVTPNPLTTTVMEGAGIVRKEGIEVIVAIGGGSIMDCAKGIAMMSVSDGDINDYLFGRIQLTNALPLILVPTTCGTGSEGNGIAVISNPETNDKKGFKNPLLFSRCSLIDSELMETMPKSVLSSVGFDALCHLMEAYVHASAQPITDVLSLYGMKLVAEHLPALTSGTGNADDWDSVVLASTLGGMVINVSGCTLPHAMEHPASGIKDITHGRGLAALTPVIVAHTWQGTEKFGDISRILGGTGASDCADMLRAFLRKIDLDINLSRQGITEADIPWMVENLFQVSPGNHKAHPVVISKEEIAQIYREAL